MRRSGLLALALALVTATAALAAAVDSNSNVVFDPGLDGVVAPRLIAKSHVAPLFPPAALKARMSGTVVVAAVIQADGAIEEVVVLDSDRPKLGFEEAAAEALAQWRFEPATRDGIAVPSYRVVRVHFGGRAQGRDPLAYGIPELIGSPLPGLGDAISAKGAFAGGLASSASGNQTAVSGPVGREVVYEVNLPPTGGMYDRSQLVPTPEYRPQPSPIGRP